MPRRGLQAFGEDRVGGDSYAGIAHGEIRDNHAQRDAVRRILRCRNEKGGLKTAAFAGIKHLEALHDAAADQHFSVNVDLA